MSKTISQALSAFITILREGNAEYGIPSHNAPDLLDRWSIDMETQVNVNASLGVPTDVKGVYQDKQNPDQRFWPLRIPKGANTETPVFEDKRMQYPPVVYAAGIGCTGWDWKNQVSKWVGFDFDAITTHAEGVGVSDEELDRVKQAACELPWVEVRRSTSGNGLHLYVLLEDIKTLTHTEHAALGRCVLGMMSSETGFDFASRIDACGGNMWIWHRKMTTENRGLELIKAASCKIGHIDLPTNWKDHVDVVRRKRAKVGVSGVDNEDKFDKLAAAQQSIVLDEGHHRVIEELKALRYACEWVSDHNCARIHTKALEELKEVMAIRGVYQTNSKGSDPNTPNAFMFPLPEGGWSVYRFSPGIAEAATWEQDGEGWTTCQFNVDADLKMAARANGGLLDGEKNGYAFPTAADALEALKLLGGKAPIPEKLLDRRAMLKVDKTGHITIDIDKDKTDDEKSPEFRSLNKGKSRWYFTTEVQQEPAKSRAAGQIDSLLKLAKTPQSEDAGWLIPTKDGKWVWTSRENARISLLNHGFKKDELDGVVSLSIFDPWTLVNLPFQPMYPGGRQINFGAPQYRFQPADTDEPHHPHWDMIFDHCFQDLNAVLPENEWARQNNILTGREYGLLWFACLLREPFMPLPYLFLFGPQNSGKSILFEIIEKIITTGVVSADRAFKSKSDFNGELANAVLAYIDETNIAEAGPQVYNKLKSWVTAPTISIRKMRTDSYQQPNTLHFIQCNNSRDACPVFDGDTRIVMLYVPKPETDIPKLKLFAKLEEEAPHFMKTVLDLQLPSMEGRLRIPVIETESKRRAEALSRDPLQEFIAEHCIYVKGERLKFSDFYEKFRECLPDDDELRREFTNRRTSHRLPDNFPTTKGAGNATYILNMAWKTQPSSQSIPTA